MAKLKKLNRVEMSRYCLEIMQNISVPERTTSNVQRIFKRRGIVPPVTSTIYRCKVKIKQLEDSKIKTKDSTFAEVDSKTSILESINYIRIDDIESIKSIMSKIGIEDFKRIVSILS